MRRLLDILGDLLGLLVVGALIVVLALTFGRMQRWAEPSSQVFPSPIETSLLSPYPPPATPPYPPPGTPTIVQPTLPICTFATPGAAIMPAPSLDTCVFSEPQVVLTYTAAIGIAGWLPDSQRLLIARDIPGINRQAIETLDIRSGRIHVYAERGGANGKPIWLSGLDTVAYSTLVGQQHELWISQRDPTQAEQIAQSVQGLSVATDPDGQRLLYFTSLATDQPRLQDVATRTEQVMPLDLAHWKYPKYPEPVQRLLGFSVFRIAWQPNGSYLVFYTQPWTFLFDMKTNQGCEIDLGRFLEGLVEIMPIWALEAKWSPDGHDLALITTSSAPGKASGPGWGIQSTELTIVNVTTGALRTLQFAPDINPGQHYVTDIDWAPDSRYLATLVVVGIDETGSEQGGIFIVDATTGEFQRGPSSYDLGGGPWGWQLAWSPDGAQLAVNCPTPEVGRLCMIPVHFKGSQER